MGTKLHMDTAEGSTTIPFRIKIYKIQFSDRAQIGQFNSIVLAIIESFSKM